MIVMTQQTLEARLAVLEVEVATLKRQIQDDQSGKTWLDRITGSMEDIPEFDEVLELGKAARKADTGSMDQASE